MNTKIRVENLPLEAKLTIMTAVFAAFMVSPMFWGIVVLVALQAGTPWPFIAVTATVVVVVFSWTVLWGRIKSDLLVAFDVIMSIGLFLMLLGTGSESWYTSFVWKNAIYMICVFQIFFHASITLFAALGFTVTAKVPETEPAKA